MNPAPEGQTVIGLVAHQEAQDIIHCWQLFKIPVVLNPQRSCVCWCLEGPLHTPAVLGMKGFQECRWSSSHHHNILMYVSISFTSLVITYSHHATTLSIAGDVMHFKWHDLMCDTKLCSLLPLRLVINNAKIVRDSGKKIKLFLWCREIIKSNTFRPYSRAQLTPFVSSNSPLMHNSGQISFIRRYAGRKEASLYSRLFCNQCLDRAAGEGNNERNAVRWHLASPGLWQGGNSDVVKQSFLNTTALTTKRRLDLRTVCVRSAVYTK